MRSGRLCGGTWTFDPAGRTSVLFHHLGADPDRVQGDEELGVYSDELIAALAHPYPRS